MFEPQITHTAKAVLNYQMLTVENHLTPFPFSIPQLTQPRAMSEHANGSFFCALAHAVPSAWSSLSSPSTFRWSIQPLTTSSAMSSFWESDAPSLALLGA